MNGFSKQAHPLNKVIENKQLTISFPYITLEGHHVFTTS